MQKEMVLGIDRNERKVSWRDLKESVKMRIIFNMMLKYPKRRMTWKMR